MTGRARLLAVAGRLGLGLGLLVCVSCGPKPRALYPVQGKILFEGKPADGAVVVLHPVDDPSPQAVRPAGHVGADGSFTLNSYLPSTQATGPGAPAGEYAVTVTWPPPDVKNYLIKHHTSDLPDKLQGRFANAASSPLPRAKVPEGPTELPLYELKRGG
jgi:hypothetical protein